ncbi:MAG: AbrB family transcriptional regulator, partial [Pseudomonadota bacterium]
VGLPMPYLLGSLVVVSSIAIMRSAGGKAEAKFPEPVRRAFVAMIGAMIGATFTADLLSVVPTLWISLLAVPVFVVVALALGFVIYRYIGGYDLRTALFSAMPGGLIDSVALGEAAGGDGLTLAVQHFARIVLVVLTVPMGFYIWSGEVVGSAAGQALSNTPWDWADVAILSALALIGLLVGPRLRLPAYHLTGPLVLSAAFHASGIYQTSNPDWLLNVSQLVVGTGLGTMFAGVKLSRVGRAFGLGALYVASVLVLGLAMALGLVWLKLGVDGAATFEALFISLSPGGITEMGLIALSLGVSPVVVSAHHLFRIIVTVFIAGILAKRLALK